MTSMDSYDFGSPAFIDSGPPVGAMGEMHGDAPCIAQPTVTRVLHLINGEHYSGAERVQDLLALRLPEFGFEVGFACVKPGKFPQARHARDIPLFSTPMKSRFDLSAMRKLSDIVRQHDYQLIHAHTPRTLMLGAYLKARTKLPLVYHVHSPTSRDSTRAMQNWVNTRIESIGMRMADQLIAVSGSLAQWLTQQGIAKSRIRVVRNGVPVATTRRDAIRPAGPWTIGSVALFRPRKGMEVLIDALALLRDRGLSIRLRAVGPFETEDYERKIKKQVQDRGLEPLVGWTGFSSNVSQEFTQMDLFALPSLFGEGLPMVVLEAMAAGVPVIGTLVEGVPEAVRDGLEGALAQPNDAVAFADAIQRTIVELDWNKLQSQAIARHAELFSDRSMAAGVADAYRALRRTKPVKGQRR